MVNERAKAYSEVFAIIKLMEPKYIKKIQNKLKKVIIHEMDKKYKPDINPNIPLKEQNLCKKTYTILAMLNINYWCEGQEKKNELIQLYKNNDKLKEKEALKKYDPYNIFKSQKQTEETTNQITSMVEYKESIFTKIINLFKKFIKR